MRLLFSALLLFFFMRPAWALITETQALSFGQFALTSNASTYQMVISPLGGFSQDPQFVTIVAPVEGVYDVSGFPASTALMINITPPTLSSVDGGDDFSVINPVIAPATVTTDPSGNATFSVGVTLQTSGGGGFYPNSAYTGTMTITVNF